MPVLGSDHRYVPFIYRSSQNTIYSSQIHSFGERVHQQMMIIFSSWFTHLQCFTLLGAARYLVKPSPGCILISKTRWAEMIEYSQARPFAIVFEVISQTYLSICRLILQRARGYTKGSQL